VELDSKLFFKYIEDLNNLEYVILEVDYHTLELRQLNRISEGHGIIFSMILNSLVCLY